MNNECSINEEDIVTFNSDEIVETKVKVIEYPSPIVVDRPNTMKLKNKQCLFSLQVRFSHLPLTIEAAGNDKSVFRFYVSFGLDNPDSSKFDKRFDGNYFTITEDMTRGILQQMLNDPQKRFIGSQILKGQNLSKSYSQQLRGVRSTTSNLNRVSMREATDESLLGKTSEMSLGSNAFLTSTGDLKSNRKDTGFQGALLEEELDCSEALFSLTIRCYSNTPQILLTAKISKTKARRKRYNKNIDPFSVEAKEEWKKSVEENNELRHKILNIASTSGFRTSRNQYRSLLNRQPSTSKIQKNKKIAKDFLSHRLEHMKALEAKSEEVAKHVQKSEAIKRMLRDERSKKIEEEYAKRIYLRRTREARDARVREVAFQSKSIVFLKLFQTLLVLQNRYRVLREQKIKDRWLNKCASVIQKHWRIFSDNVLPRFKKQRRFLDSIFVSQCMIRTCQAKVQKQVKTQIGTYMANCFDQVKLKTAFYQCSLYTANIQRRYRTYATNQRLNVTVLRKLWEKEYSTLVRIHTIDKSVAALSNITHNLANVSEETIHRILKQLYKVQWLHFMRHHGAELFSKSLAKSSSPTSKKSPYALKKVAQLEQYTLVKNPKNGFMAKKRVMKVGSTSVLDSLTNCILRAPENYLLNKVRPFDAWIAQAEEAEDKLLVGKKLSHKLSRTKSSLSQKLEIPQKSTLQQANSETIESDSENSDYSEERKEKIQSMLSKLPAVAKFFESRFDPMKFKVEITPQQMKSLIMETANFKASIGDEDLHRALASASLNVDLGEPFLSKFYPENVN